VVEGDRLIFPAPFALEVVGLDLGDAATTELREYGFSKFKSTPTGFVALKA
jgi:hypothetical protein